MDNQVNIKGVTCYGKMQVDATVSIVGTYDNGEEFESMYLGSQGFTTWTQLVSYYLKDAYLEGLTIEEMESDM